MSPEMDALLVKLIVVGWMVYLFVRVLRLEEAIQIRETDRKLRAAAAADLEFDVRQLEARMSQLEALS